MTEVKRDCLYYRGDIPCKPHKKEGVHCSNCTYYTARAKRILIIKLGAIGDVIRTTPLLTRLRSEYPHAEIVWLTDFPDVIPSDVDRVYTVDTKSIEILRQTPFDIVYSLDKDREACAIANTVSAKAKHGFILDDGFCYPADKKAEHKWLTGLFDDINRENKKSYPFEIFEMCGFEYHGEEYIVELSETRGWDLPGQGPVIGLNTGCGARWTTRLWPEKHWADLSSRLITAGYRVVLLGGRQEDGTNTRIAEETGAIYPGYFPLPVFFSLVDQCDLVVTAVSMAFHVALGLGKKVVLFNNIFNPREFELFGRGTIIQPEMPCLGCFRGTCDKECMSRITSGRVFDAVKALQKTHKTG